MNRLITVELLEVGKGIMNKVSALILEESILSPKTGVFPEYLAYVILFRP